MTLVLAVLLALPPAGFNTFSYCRDNARGPFETQCVILDSSGKGDVRFKRRAADPIEVRIQLSNLAARKFVAVIDGSNRLQDGAAYESGKRVADLGRKTLTIELPEGKREAVFNYSTRKEVIELVAFFEGLINQETLAFDFDRALQFERLSIPKRLEFLENELKAGRIADPERLTPLLDRIESDTRIVNFARTRAGQVKEQVKEIVRTRK